MFTEAVMLSNCLILCNPLLLLPSVFSSTRIFSSELVLHIRRPKYCSFSNRPSKEYLGLIFFRIDWFDLPADQGTLKSLFQHHSSKHQFFGASVLYGPTLTSIHDYWKNHSFDYIDLCQQSDVLAFNSLSRLVIAFLPRNSIF